MHCFRTRNTPKKTKTTETTPKDTPSSTYNFKKPTFSSQRKKSKSLKQLQELTTLSWNYWSISVPPSVRPRNRYCDVTGLPASYTDPKTGLRYHSAVVYQFARSLGPDSVQQFLKIRNAHTIVK